MTRGRPIPGRPSDGITRRRLLALASGAIAAGILAACGEEARAELAGVALPDISRPARRAPRDVGLPEPGEGRPIQIAMTSYGSSFGGGVGLDVVAVLSTASRISRDRFDFGWSEVRSVPPYVEWDMSAAIADLIPPLPDVILFHTGEFADLVAGGSLDPLEPHLAIDPGFEPGAYWPGVLEAGQVDGRQFALPVVAVPRIVIVNRALAASREVKLPPADRLAFDRDAFFELARRLNAAPDDDGGTPGLLMRVNPDADPATQMFTAPPLTPYAHVFLASAVGGIGSPDGSYDGLRTESAVRAVEDLQAMVNDLGYALPGEEFLRNLRAQNFGMFVAGFGGAKPAGFDSAIYPFPDFGSGRNPARIDWLAGVAATSGDPAAAYRAVTPIASGLAQVARFPALRTSAEELQILYRDLTIEEAELMVDLLEHAALIGIDRRDWPVLIGQIDAGAVLGGLDPAEALNRAADELAALRRG